MKSKFLTAALGAAAVLLSSCGSHNEDVAETANAAADTADQATAANKALKERVDDLEAKVAQQDAEIAKLRSDLDSVEARVHD